VTLLVRARVAFSDGRSPASEGHGCPIVATVEGHLQTADGGGALIVGPDSDPLSAGLETDVLWPASSGRRIHGAPGGAAVEGGDEPCVTDQDGDIWARAAEVALAGVQNADR